MTPATNHVKNASLLWSTSQQWSKRDEEKRAVFSRPYVSPQLPLMQTRGTHMGSYIHLPTLVEPNKLWSQVRRPSSHIHWRMGPVFKTRWRVVSHHLSHFPGNCDGREGTMNGMKGVFLVRKGDVKLTGGYSTMNLPQHVKFQKFWKDLLESASFMFTNIFVGISGLPSSPSHAPSITLDLTSKITCGDQWWQCFHLIFLRRRRWPQLQQVEKKIRLGEDVCRRNWTCLHEKIHSAGMYMYIIEYYIENMNIYILYISVYK